jgi:hypothetical protein
MDTSLNTVTIMDTGLLDNATAISRYWTSDWIDFAQPGDKYLTRVDIVMGEDSGSEIEVSSRVDFSEQYVQKRRYGISAAGNDTDIVITHNLTPQLGRWHDLKIQFFPKTLGSQMQLKRVDMFYTPVSKLAHKQTPLNVKGA